MTDRETRHNYGVGDYWNLGEDLVDALESSEAKLKVIREVAERMCDNRDPPRVVSQQ